MGKKKREVYLPRKEIKLKDGETYCFRAVPFTEDIEDSLTVLFGEADGIENISASMKIVRKSLSYDQDQETIEYLIGNGVIDPRSDQDTFKDIINAALNQ